MANTGKVTIQITVELVGAVEKVDLERLKKFLTSQATESAQKWHDVEIAQTDCYCSGLSHHHTCKFHVIPY